MFVCVGTFWRQLKLVKEAASKKKVGGRGYRGFTPEEVDTASGIGLLILVPFKRHLLSLVLHKVKCICAQVCASMVRGNQNFQILVGHTNRISGSYLHRDTNWISTRFFFVYQKHATMLSTKNRHKVSVSVFVTVVTV